MNSNLGFYKYNDKYVEGYLSNKEKFNGVLFLLREPNSENQDDFWFKNMLNSDVSERSFTLYKNKFNIFLEYLSAGYRLEDCAYANIIPNKGERFKSCDYSKLSNTEIYERFINIINECDNKVKYVFTCTDIFDAIREKGNGKIIDAFGVKYENVKSEKRVMLVNGVTIYEIFHPSYTRYPNRYSLNGKSAGKTL